MQATQNVSRRTLMEPTTRSSPSHWGDVWLPSHPKQAIRVLIQNVHGLPVLNTHFKNQQLRSTINAMNVDILLASEINVHWRKLPYTQRLSERVRGWWEAIHVVTANNETTTEPEPFQFGGVLALARNQAAHRVRRSGYDPERLGRWCWLLLPGKADVRTRFISAYRPTRNTQGPTSVLNQQQRHFLSTQRRGCPREIFDHDLLAAVRQWVNEGDQILIGIDLNEDIRTSSLTRSLEEIGLIELNLARHGQDVPPTHIRGSRPIDAVFGSANFRNANCGVLDFGEAIASDHRALWIDIPHSLVFGHAIQECSRPQMRRLQCLNPRVVKAYTARLEAMLTAHNVSQRVRQLQSSCSQPPTPENIAEWDAIDQIRVRAMLESEKRCRKLRVGSVPWSPTIQRDIDRISYWQLAIKRLQHRKISSRLLARLRTKAHLPRQIVTLDVAYSALKQVKAEYKQHKSEADTLRATWIEELAQIRATELGGKADRQLRTMRAREVARSEARICRKAVGKARSSGVLSVVALNPSGQWIEHTSAEQIAKACIQENQQRFQQAANTPFLQSPLRLLVDPMASNSIANTIRDGHFEAPRAIDQYTKDFITQLARPPSAVQSPMNTDIRFDEYCDRWRRSREYTATGHSGLHFGHFMANTTQPTLAAIDWAMIQLPFSHGFSPSRWQVGLDVALLKKPGNYRVDSLRTILLLEPDYNFLNKILGARMMANAEQLNLLAIEQYGSRKLKSASEHVLNKRLTFDLSRQLKRPIALCSNDAKSCYDRIVWPVASLAMQRVGIPQPPITTMLKTLQQMRHHIRTSFGTSLQFYRSSDTHKYHGVGQGNGAAPAIWAVVSTPILNAQRQAGFGLQLQSPLSKESLHIAGYSFVDDTDLCQSASLYNDANQVIAQLQAAIERWQGSLSATGGALVPNKSFWVLSSFKWQDGRWFYDDSRSAPGQIQMRCSDGTSQAIERIEPGEGRRTLGVRLAADGSNQAEVTFLRTRSVEWAAQIRQGHLPKPLVWRALTTMLWPQFRYPLPATTFTARECRFIMAPALKAGLAASGTIGTFPRVLTHATPSIFGLGLWDLYHAQGWAHLTAALKHGPDPASITGRLLRCSIETHQLEIGLSGTLFDWNFDQVGHLATESWAKSLWRFVWQYDLHLQADIPPIQVQRQNDQTLTQLFLSLGFRRGDLLALNRCRLYLQVVTMADICSGCGHHILKKAKEGIRDNDLPRAMGWPIQGRPSASDWAVWRKALSLACHNSKQDRLPQALGVWTQTTPLLAWLYSPGQARLYRQIAPDNWVYHIGTTSRSGRSTSRRFRVSSMSTTQAELPSDLIRGHAITTPQDIIVTGFVPTLIREPDPRPTTFSMYLQSPNQPWAGVFEEATISDQIALLPQALQTNQCQAVCDGSFGNGLGSISWTVVVNFQHVVVQGGLVLPGPSELMTPLRSEIAGIYSTVLTVWLTCEFFQVDQGGITIGCDCKQALHLCFGTGVVQPTSPNYDLILATRSLINRTHLLWHHHYIPAHQDQGRPRPLDFWAQTNIHLDLQAKHIRTTKRASLTPKDHWFGETWFLSTKLYKFPYMDKDLFLSHLTQEPGVEYWIQRRKIGPDAAPLIDYGGIRQALRDSTLTRRLWVSKYTAGFVPVGSRMKLQKMWDHDRCPRCSEPETPDHIVTCQAPHMSTLWHGALLRLEKWMGQTHTCPQIGCAILHYLRTWLEFPSVRPPLGQDLVNQAVTAQALIGWDSFHKGFVSRLWAEAQDRHYRLLGRTQSGKRWLTQLLRKLWDTSWDFWLDRNGHLHQPEAARDKELNEQILEQYSLGWDSLPVSDQQWFRETSDIILAKPRRIRRAWLHHVCLLRDRATRDAEIQISRSRQCMRRWLSTPSNR